MSLFQIALVGVSLCFATACSSDSSSDSDPDANASGRDCKTNPGSLTFTGGLAAEVGNGCAYTISLGDQEVSTGTCNVGAMANDVSAAPPPGGMQLGMQGRIDQADDAAGLTRRFDLARTSTGSWNDRAGKPFGAHATYQQGPTALNSTSSIQEAQGDPRYLYADCTVSGKLDSVRDVCIFGTNEQYEIHGTLDGSCKGLAGSAVSSNGSPEVSIHVEL